MFLKILNYYTKSLTPSFRLTPQERKQNENIMTVKELRNKLTMYPDEMLVFVAERKTDFAYGLVNSIYKKEIVFQEDPDGEALSTDDVVILDEE